MASTEKTPAPDDKLKDTPQNVVREGEGSEKKGVNKIDKHTTTIVSVGQKVTESQRKVTESQRKLKEAQEREEEDNGPRILSDFLAPENSSPNLTWDEMNQNSNKPKIPELSTFAQACQQAEHDLQKSKENFSNNLGERYASQMASVRDTGTLDALDPEGKKMVHTEIIYQTLKPEEISKNYVEQAQKEILGPNFQGPISPEQDILLKDRALQLQATTIQSEYQKALEADREMNPLGTTSQEYLKKFSPTQQAAVTLEVLKHGDAAHLDGEAGVNIAERVLAERGLNDYLAVIGSTDFDVAALPENLRKQVMLNPEFTLPESIKQQIISERLAIKNREIPIDRTDFQEGDTGDKQYVESVKKFTESRTGYTTDEIGELANKVGIDTLSNPDKFKNINPFLKFLADILAPFGAMMDGPSGDFWRKYMRDTNATGRHQEYAQDGHNSPPFSVEKVTSGPDLINSAKKYLGRPYKMGGLGRLDVPGDPIDCSQLVVNSLNDVGCVPKGFDTTASGFASRSQMVKQKEGKPGDFLIRTSGGSDHIAIITGGPDENGNYTTIESTSKNSAGSGVIETSRQASGDDNSEGFKVYKNPFLEENVPEVGLEKTPEGGESKNISSTHYWYEKKHDSQLDHWTAKGQTSTGVSLFDSSGRGITPETHGYGFCAVDPDIIPYGSLVIMGGKKYYAVDTGSAVKSKEASIKRGVGDVPVVDFFSKHPVGIEAKGRTDTIRVIPKEQSDRTLAQLKAGYIPPINGQLANLEGLQGSSKQICDLALKQWKEQDINGAYHCTDWVDKIYKSTIGTSVYNTRLLFNGVANINRGTGLGASQYASEGDLNRIQPSHHLILDKPGKTGQYNIGRTHSVIALGVPKDGLVQVVSYPNSKIPPKVEMYDLRGQGRGDKDGKVIRIQGI